MKNKLGLFAGRQSLDRKSLIIKNKQCTYFLQIQTWCQKTDRSFHPPELYEHLKNKKLLDSNIKSQKPLFHVHERIETLHSRDYE